MGNSGFNLRKFLSNKNTVTILAVFVGVVVLYLAYNYRVKQAIEPKSVPVANQKLVANTIITSDMIEYVNVTSSFIRKSPNLVLNASQLVGKRIATGNNIPESGFFYTDQLSTNETDVDPTTANIPDGYTVFELDVDSTKTYGNSIYPGNYIDLYLYARYDDGRIMYGKFIESIEVLDVKDSQGKPVFDGSDNASEPSVLVFAVPEDMYLLLTKATLLNFVIYPVPRNASYSANPGDTIVKSEFLKTYILSKSAVIPD